MQNKHLVHSKLYRFQMIDIGPPLLVDSALRFKFSNTYISHNMRNKSNNLFKLDKEKNWGLARTIEF